MYGIAFIGYSIPLQRSVVGAIRGGTEGRARSVPGRDGQLEILELTRVMGEVCKIVSKGVVSPLENRSSISWSGRSVMSL